MPKRSAESGDHSIWVTTLQVYLTQTMNIKHHIQCVLSQQKPELIMKSCCRNLHKSRSKAEIRHFLPVKCEEVLYLKS